MNEKELNIEKSEYLFEFCFQFKIQKYLKNRRRIDRSKINEKIKK